MEGDFSGNTFNVEEEGRSEANYSFAVDGVIGIPRVDGFL